MTGEDRDVYVVEFPTDRHPVFLIPVGAAAQKRFDSVDIAAPSRLEMDHAAERGVIVERRRGAAGDFHALHEPGVVHVEAGKSIRLCLSDAVLVELQVAHDPRRLHPRAADRHAEVPRSVRRTKHHAGQRLHRFFHRACRLRIGLGSRGGRERQTLRMFLHPFAHDADIGQFVHRRLVGGRRPAGLDDGLLVELRPLAGRQRFVAPAAHLFQVLQQFLALLHVLLQPFPQRLLRLSRAPYRNWDLALGPRRRAGQHTHQHRSPHTCVYRSSHDHLTPPFSATHGFQSRP